MSLFLAFVAFLLWETIHLSRENATLRAQVTSPICTGLSTDGTDSSDVHSADR